MRHSDVRLTMNVYTDPRLLDLVGAMDALPALSIDPGVSKLEAAKGTGTSSRPVAPTSFILGQKLTIADKKPRPANPA